MAKGIMYINGQRVAFDGEKNVLAVIRKAGINMPTLCYYSDLSVYGACRMCVVEDDRGRIDASCSMEPRDGLSIQTNTARLLKYRRMIIELLLASHDRDCTVCEKSSACELRRLALRFGVRRVRFEDTREQLPLDTSSPSVVRDPNKCILCGDCVRTCEEIQGMNIIDFTHRSADLRVMPAFDQKLAETDCIGCGQCRKICAHGAPIITDDKAVIDHDRCVGCGRCIAVCPKNAVQINWDETTTNLNRKIAEYTKAVVDGRPCFHISLVIDVSPNCDCRPENDMPIVPNVGMFASFDPVALDMACVDAVNAQTPLRGSAADDGEGHVHEHDHFRRIHPDTDWRSCLEHGEKIGIGVRDYELIKI